MGFRIMLGLLLLASAAERAQAQAVKPNVMILLDSSGSMGDLVTVLKPYYSTATYDSVGYSSSAVYAQNQDGTYSLVYDSTYTVPSSAARASLSDNGFWFGTISNEQFKFFMGNYLNYSLCTTSCVTAAQKKISIAQHVIAQLVKTMTDVQFGVMKFVNNSSQRSPPGRGGVVASIGTSTDTIISLVNAVTATGFTPQGEQLQDAGSYFRGTFGYPTPITSQCQQNSVFIVSDGMWNGLINPASQASVEYTNDHSALPGTQNLITNTIGFSVSPSEAGQALTSLQNTASNGGGKFFVANDPAQLSQALFTLPAAVTITSPLQGSILTGNVSITGSVQTSVCVSKVQFYLDGDPLGSAVTAPPYSTTWDTTLVANGTHTLTAVSHDLSGSQSASYPVVVTLSNVQTPPVVSDVTQTVWFTSATISWRTNVLTDAQILYGLTSTYDQSTILQDTNPRTLVHTVLLTGLIPGTDYHYKIISRDAAGNVIGYGDLIFHTSSVVVPPAAGPIDHFTMRFLNSGTQQLGPGTKSGTYPYILTVGDCFSVTIEAVDASNNHSNFTGQVTLAQYLLNNVGLPTGLAPGIALRNNFQLGVSSMDFTMTNGYLFLGSDTDITKQLCFYRASREPLDSKQPGAVGDFHLKVIETDVSSVTAVSDSYVAWRGAPDRLALVLPNQALAPATPYGLDGTLSEQNQGIPFTLRAYLTDQYWNQVLNSVDVLRFSSSLSDKTGFSPFSAALSTAPAVSSATVNACDTSVTLTVEDETHSAMTAGQSVLQMAACGAMRFYDLFVPMQATAGAPFVTTITVYNAGPGPDPYSGRLIALTQVDATHFTPATTVLGVPTFNFTTPAGTVTDSTYTILTQSYTKAGTIWVQLVAEQPSDLRGATVMSAPLQIVPGPAQQLTLTQTPSVVAAFTNSQIVATLTDVYGNGISGQNVIIDLTQGSGGLGASGNLLSVSLVTDSAGQASTNFRSGGFSETNSIRASIPGIPTIVPTNGQVLVTLLGDKRVAAYPNPVMITQRQLTIEYQLDRASDVKLVIVDLFGREVWRTSFSPGSTGGLEGFNRISWDGRNGMGRTVAAGVYALHLDISASGQNQKASTKFGIKK